MYTATPMYPNALPQSFHNYLPRIPSACAKPSMPDTAAIGWPPFVGAVLTAASGPAFCQFFCFTGVLTLMGEETDTGVLLLVCSSTHRVLGCAQSKVCAVVHTWCCLLQGTRKHMLRQRWARPHLQGT